MLSSSHDRDEEDDRQEPDRCYQHSWSGSCYFAQAYKRNQLFMGDCTQSGIVDCNVLHCFRFYCLAHLQGRALLN